MNNQFENLSLIGRTYISEDKLFFNFSGSGFECCFEGTKAVLTFYATKYSEVNSRPYISIIVDGVRNDYSLENELTTIVVTSDKECSQLQVLKRSETSCSSAALVHIDCLKYYKTPSNDKLKLEFYGDSLTCGYGVLTNNPKEPFTTKTESFLDAYPYMLAKKLNAKYSAVCVSGFPISKCRWNQGFDVESICDMTDFSDYNEQMTFENYHKWNNKHYIPDIVIINLGTNDCSYFTEGQDWIDELMKINGSYDKVRKTEEYRNKIESILTKMHQFLNKLNDLYNHPLIIWATGMIKVDEDVDKIIDLAIETYNENNVLRYKFFGFDKVTDFGANSHPSMNTHKEAANQLYDFIIERLMKTK